MGSFLSLSLPSASLSVSKATQTEWNCPVCHSVQSDTAAVPCGHQCCLGCLLRHTATSATCPLCASPMLSARFSVQGRNDFLQCILSPPGVPLGPATWARKALFRLVYTRPSDPQAAPAPAEPAGAEAAGAGPEAAEELPGDLWVELLHGHEHLLDPVRPWLRQSLDAIYGSQWWEARQVESIALSTLCICGPDRNGLTHMLQSYLGEYTAPLIQGLIHVTLHRCRDPWLRRRSQGALEEGGERLVASAGPGLAASPAWPGLGAQPSEPELARPEGPDRPPALPAPAGLDRPWAVPEQPQFRAGPQDDAPAPGPSVPRRGRSRRPRATRHSQRRRPSKYPHTLKVRRKQRRK